jgi:hypothetical protein
VPREPLTAEEIAGIVLAVKSAFLKLRNLYDKITPVFDEYGFRAHSAGVVARGLSEKIETSIIQHCRTFTRGLKHADLARFNKFCAEFSPASKSSARDSSIVRSSKRERTTGCFRSRQYAIGSPLTACS